DGLDRASAEPAFWLASQQQLFRFARMQLVIRTAGDPSAVTGTLRATVRRLNPNLAVSNISQMDQIAGGSFATHRFSLFLVGLFSMVALSVAAGGVFWVGLVFVRRRLARIRTRVAR